MTAERQSFAARTETFPAVAAFVEKRCGELAVDRQATLRLLLVAEELFINAAVHGYRESAGEVTLTVRDCGGEVELVVEDAAPAFDPFKDLAQPVVPADPREGAIGGLGRALVAGISARHAYERRGDRNRVTVGVLKRRD
jgi:serine/threonine-protein kinase RsbW